MFRTGFALLAITVLIGLVMQTAEADADVGLIVWSVGMFAALAFLSVGAVRWVRAR
jgi:hypothetical protein